MHPLVSVIIVSFNSIKTIQLTISSLLNQIYKNFEIIYIDGGSNDGTREYILKYLRKKDKVIFEPDYGIYDAMNKGLLHADGKYIFFLNSDDLYIDDRVISDVVEKFIQDESVDIVLGGVEYFNGSPLIRSGRKWINYTYKEGDFIHGWHPPHPGFFSKKSCYDLWGLFDSSIKIAADLDVMLRFIHKNKAKVACLGRITTLMEASGVSGNWRGRGLGLFNVIESYWKNGIRSTLIYTLIMRYFDKI